MVIIFNTFKVLLFLIMNINLHLLLLSAQATVRCAFLRDKRITGCNYYIIMDCFHINSSLCRAAHISVRRNRVLCEVVAVYSKGQYYNNTVKQVFSHPESLPSYCGKQLRLVLTADSH